MTQVNSNARDSDGQKQKNSASIAPELQPIFAAMRSNEYEKAEISLRDFLQTNPTDVNALLLLAGIMDRRGRYNEARALYSKCLELAPDFSTARLDYAKHLVNIGEFGLAITHLERLLQGDADHAGYNGLLAYALGQIGDYAPALRSHEKVLQAVPREPAAWMAYANDLRACGRQRDCVSAYLKVLELDPKLGEAWWNLANLKTFRFSPSQITAMRATLQRTDLTLRNRCMVHFSLGKAFEDAEDFADSFDQYRRGNALYRTSINYDADRSRSEFRQMKKVFSRSLFQDRSNAGCTEKGPVFVVGLPRSGSTLVEQILSSHSEIEGTRELPNIAAIVRGIEPPFPESVLNLEATSFAHLGQKYLDETRMYRKLGRPLFVDKMPGNFAFVGLIHLILPNAKIIDVRRNPLDCCAANFKQIFTRSHSFSYNLNDLGRHYCDYVGLMAHFDEVLPGKIHRVFYERLVRSPESEIARLLEYLDLPFEQECLRFYENDRAVRTASSEQVRLPIYTSAIGGWQKYEPWLGTLKSALAPVL